MLSDERQTFYFLQNIQLITNFLYFRREVANKEEELEDVRAAAQKKVKALEQQLENEHEERINFVREKHELETRIINLQVKIFIERHLAVSFEVTLHSTR